MKRLVAVDPDTKESGLAFFVDGVLIDARAAGMDLRNGAVEQLHEFLGGPDCTVVCEMPQHYGGQGDVRDFLAVARVVGRFEQIAHDTGAAFEAIASKKWKGETPKNICGVRAWSVLSFGEQGEVDILEGSKKRLDKGDGFKSGSVSDVLDAIGIGLWKLGRLHGGRR